MPSEPPVAAGEPRMDPPTSDVADANAAAALLADRSRSAILRMFAGGRHFECAMTSALRERADSLSNRRANVRDARFVGGVRRKGNMQFLSCERDEPASAAALGALAEVLA